MKKPYFFGQHNKSGQNIVSAHTAWPSFPCLHFVVMAFGKIFGVAQVKPKVEKKPEKKPEPKAEPAPAPQAELD